LHNEGNFNLALAQTNFEVKENIEDALQFEDFCDEVQLLASEVLSNEQVVIGGKSVTVISDINSGSNVTIKAIDDIDLVSGFDAKPGAEVTLEITDCQGVQNAIQNSL